MEGQSSGSATAQPSTQAQPQTQAQSQPKGQNQNASTVQNGQSRPQSQNGQATKSDPAAAQSEAEVKKEIRRLAETDLDAVVEVSIDGERKEMTVRELQKLSQLEQTSRKKMTEADQMKRQLRGVFEQARTDPRVRDELMRHMGIGDKYEFAEMTLAEKLERMQESPEQRELRELREERQQRAEQEKILKEQTEKEHFTRLEQEAQNSFNQEFLAAWQTSGLPPDRLFGQLIAAEMVAAKQGQGQDLNWKQAAGKVKEKFFKTSRSSFEHMDATAIHQVLGDAVFKKIREFELAKVKRAPPTLSSGQRNESEMPQPQRQRRSNQPLDEKGYRAWVESLKSGG